MNEPPFDAAADAWRVPLRDRLVMLRPPLPGDRPRVRESCGPPVILLHGLLRGKGAMEPLARHLHGAGFHTVNLPYPSGRRSLTELVELLRPQVLRHCGDRPPHFVTHSLGGILVRCLLGQWDGPPPGRVVMLAPPNQGSTIVDQLGERRIGRVLGPAGRSLGTRTVPGRIPPLPAGVECAVIMGRRSWIPFFHRWLGPEHDGIVSVEDGRIDGMKAFHVVDADHTFIAGVPAVQRLVAGFLRDNERAGE